MRAPAILIFAVGLLCVSRQADCGTATANLTVQMTITASCTIGGATLTFPSTSGTSLTTVAVTASTTFSVTCTNSSPYSIGMSQGLNYLTGNRMASSGNFLPYGLYLNSGLTLPWLAAASNSLCTIINECYLGTGGGAAQTITVYGLVPTTLTALLPGTYSDVVTMTVTY